MNPTLMALILAVFNENPEQPHTDRATNAAGRVASAVLRHETGVASAAAAYHSILRDPEIDVPADQAASLTVAWLDDENLVPRSGFALPELERARLAGGREATITAIEQMFRNKKSA